jgi:hypothetical protein
MFDAFREGLRALGYVEGRDVILEFRFARGDLSRCRVRPPLPSRTANRASHVRRTQVHGLFDDCIEHRLKIAGRGVDDLQDFGRRGLLVSRIRKFSLKHVSLRRALV